MPLRLLITRPEPAATRFATELRAEFPGAEVLVSPLMRIAYGGTLPALVPGEVLIFTSRHGVEGFCRLSSRRDLPACVVGEATAAEARQHGFAVIAVAEDAEGLIGRLATEEMAGPFLHARGAGAARHPVDLEREVEIGQHRPAQHHGTLKHHRLRPARAAVGRMAPPQHLPR